MSLSPLQQYQHDLLDVNFFADPEQAVAIAKLDDIYRQLCQQAAKNSLQRFLGRGKFIKGLYLWGGVGTGKSYLMNTFFNCLPFKQKVRMHFHEFMRQVHRDLKQLQGSKNPLQLVAKAWSKRCYVLCFDEFFVRDIADAMLLGNLLTALFERNVCLVATSNREPDDLYKSGLQRQRFIPAIRILQQHVDVIHVDNNIDYRLHKSKPAAVYFSPLNQQAEQLMMQSFHYYAGNDAVSHALLIINQRSVQTFFLAKYVAWFRFTDLCATALGSEDYLQIAEKYPIIMLSEIPQFEKKHNDSTVRFINFIDVIYDKHRLLIASAATVMDEIYLGEQWSFEFQRTISRLQEMSTEQYISHCDLPGDLNVS